MQKLLPALTKRPRTLSIAAVTVVGITVFAHYWFDDPEAALIASELRSLPALQLDDAPVPFSTDGVEGYALDHFFFQRSGGRFLEVGVFDGITGSHTATLERDMEWSGTLVEGSFSNFLRLQENRPLQVSRPPRARLRSRTTDEAVCLHHSMYAGSRTCRCVRE
jgi:hypothetical protein